MQQPYNVISRTAVCTQRNPNGLGAGGAWRPLAETEELFNGSAVRGQLFLAGTAACERQWLGAGVAPLTWNG